MRVTGRVVNGRIEIEKDTILPEGETVTVFVGDDAVLPLTEVEEEELWQSDQAAERGDFVTSDELFDEIRSIREER
ncbi:MAG TPA: hypothetical protein VF701_21100 [Thermoanaerobaculia bacterium]